LCAITYGSLRMDPKWRKWLQALSVPAVFQRKDDRRTSTSRCRQCCVNG